MTQRLDSHNSLRASLEERANKAAAEKKTVEERLVAAEEKMGQMAEQKDAAESRAAASQAEASSQARRVSDLESELAIMKADLEAEITAKEGLQAQLAEEKAENARKERELNEAVSTSAEQNTLLQSLSGRLAAAEQGIEAAKVDAVEAFKGGQAFADAVADCLADSYRLGFADCKGATSKLFPNLDLSKIRPPGDEELSGGEEERTEQRIAGFVDEVIEALQADGGDGEEGSAPSASAPGEAEQGPPECRI